MTELQKTSPHLFEEEYLNTADKVTYQFHQPEVRDNPVLQALAHRGRNVLEEMSLLGDTHLAREVRTTVRQLRGGAAESMMR